MEKSFQIKITGITPLLMHQDNIEWADQIDRARTEIKEKDKKLFKAGDDRCPEYTWIGSLYHDGEQVCMPTDNLRSCLVKAGAKMTLKNNITFKKVVPSAIMFEDVFVPLLATKDKLVRMADVQAIKGDFKDHVDAVKKLGFELHMKRATIGSAKHVRVRPMFKSWSLVFRCLIIDEQLDSKGDAIFKELWRIAGSRIGLCDYRPDAPKSPGPYGRFNTEVTRS